MVVEVVVLSVLLAVVVLLLSRGGEHPADGALVDPHPDARSARASGGIGL
jgi:hypothetical protein